MKVPKITRTPWTLETVPTSCGVCHKIGPFPWKGDKQNHACIYADYPSNGPEDEELLGNAVLMTASPVMAKALLNILVWHHMMGLPAHPAITEARKALNSAGYTE